MTLFFFILTFLFAVGCAPSLVPKEVHIGQVQEATFNGGGETSILNESRTLFMRLTGETKDPPFWNVRDRRMDGLSAISKLGDVFRYELSEPDRVCIRVHNSHFDTYFIFLINPDLPWPAGFESIAGNVGFINKSAPAN